MVICDDDQKGKTFNKVTKAVITRHVENLRNLDAEGKIELCGPFKGYPGVAGMVIFKTESYEEAEALCKLEPLVDVIMPGKEKVTYVHVTPEKARRIVAGHVVNGNVVTEYTVDGEKA